MFNWKACLWAELIKAELDPEKRESWCAKEKYLYLNPCISTTVLNKYTSLESTKRALSCLSIAKIGRLESWQTLSNWISFVGIAETVGDALTFKVLTDDTQKVIYHSAVHSALSPNEHNPHLSALGGESSKPIQEIVKSWTPLEGEPSTLKMVQMPTFSQKITLGAPTSLILMKMASALVPRLCTRLKSMRRRPTSILKESSSLSQLMKTKQMR